MTGILDFLLGRTKRHPAERLISSERLEMFQRAVDYINYELVEGDILEFGVFTGRTLAALAHCLGQSQYDSHFQRKVAGFDSFQGLPSSVDAHPRWEEDNCASNHLKATAGTGHGEAVTAEGVYKLFEKHALPKPAIHEGDFAKTLPAVIPSQHRAAALVHIDCDIYESAKTVLMGIEPILQDGTVLLFDDWFHYKANPQRGEQRAFGEFLKANPQWEAVHYRQYAVFCNAFIMSKKG